MPSPYFDFLPSEGCYKETMGAYRVYQQFPRALYFVYPPSPFERRPGLAILLDVLDLLPVPVAI